MSAVLLQPHQDDAALFAAFTCYLHRPHVITVLESHVQEGRGTGITNATRVDENADALAILGCTWEQWPHSDDAPHWGPVAVRINALADTYDHCFAPAVEEGGHEHHSIVGRLAAAAFGDRVTHYMTYRRGYGPSVGTQPVDPAPGALAAKLHALSCYTTQIEEPSTRPWFLGPFHEWYA